MSSVIVVESPLQTAIISYQSPPATNNLNGIEFEQSTAATEWIWNHNLGFRPVVQVTNFAYEKIHAEVIHSSANQVRVRVTPAAIGKILI